MIETPKGIQMREQLRPWIAAIYCAALGVIVILVELVLAFVNRTPNFSPVGIVFYSFLPMCFYFVGDFLSSLRKENLALKSQVEELAAKLQSKSI